MKKAFFIIWTCFFVHDSLAHFPDSLLINTESESMKITFVPDHHYDLIADRISCIESDMPLVFNEKVHSFIDYFAVRNREYTEMILSRAPIYFPLFEKYFEKYGIPQDLKYLAIVESGLNPNAISRVGAAGLWQFMPSTGAHYGLHSDWYIDERMDPEKATEAACKYLKMLYNMFGDWDLALASYNAGPGNVRAAIRRSGYKKSFWEVWPYLPKETRSYVPQFVAIAYIMQYAEEHYFFNIKEYYPIKTDTIHISGFLNIKELAPLIKTCYEDIQRLNPSIKRWAIPENVKNLPINVPLQSAKEFRMLPDSLLEKCNVGKEEIEYLARNIPGSTYGRTKIVYKVRSGDVLGSIAERHHVSISNIKKWNKLHSNTIRIGQQLNIWVYPGTTVKKSEPKKEISIPEGASTYTVQHGDTLWLIANKIDGMTIEKLKKLNNLSSNNIKVGQKLVIH